MFTSGVVALGGVPSDEANGGAWGFARVLRLEHPMLRTQSIDVLCDMSTVASSVFCDAMAEAETAWIDSAHVVAWLRACTSPSTSSRALARGSYAVTGGLGGLGLRAASLLVESGVPRVLLASRACVRTQRVWGRKLRCFVVHMLSRGAWVASGYALPR